MSAVERIHEVKSRWVDLPDDLNRFRKERNDLYQRVVKRYGCDDRSNACILRALELIEALRPTHFCFLHGQSMDAYIQTLYITKKVEKLDPSLAGKYRKFFRWPESLGNAPKDVKDFLQAHPKVRDSEFQNELLSVSGYPLARQGYESAYFFFRNRWSFNPKVDWEIRDISFRFRNHLGALQLIAVPKECAESGVYHSLPGGIPTGLSLDVLARHQNIE